MNKTSIGWTDRTYNPVTGCTKGCHYCYARRQANTRLRDLYLNNPNVAPGCDPADPFSPRFWPDRLDDPGKTYSCLKIFTCSMGELFDPTVPKEWQVEVLATIRRHKRHTFQILTKQPQNLYPYSPFPDNCWIGVTATDGEMGWAGSAWLGHVEANVKYLSVEPFLAPLHSEDGRDDLTRGILKSLDWLIVGAMTGNRRDILVAHKCYPGTWVKTQGGRYTLQPNIEWLQDLLQAADAARIAVFLKDNLDWPDKRQEFPNAP